MDVLRILYIVNAMNSSELDDGEVTEIRTDLGYKGLDLIRFMKYLKGFWK